MNKQCVVIGIGNPYRQDDRAGLVVIKQLEQAGLPCQTEVVYAAGFEVIDRIRGYKRAIIVDACQLGEEPGTILERMVDDIFSASSPVNSHTITLSTILKTGQVCFTQEMPDDISIILIQVKELQEFTEQMSPEVEAAVVEVVGRIRNRIAANGISNCQEQGRGLARRV